MFFMYICMNIKVLLFKKVYPSENVELVFQDKISSST